MDLHKTSFPLSNPRQPRNFSYQNKGLAVPVSGGVCYLVLKLLIMTSLRGKMHGALN